MGYKIKAEDDFLAYLSTDKLTKGIYNRYELVIAVAKAAREITDIQYREKEEIKNNAVENDSRKSKADIQYRQEKEKEKEMKRKIEREKEKENNFKRDKTYLKTDSVLTNENAVKTAIRRIYNGELIIVQTE